jgi:hypothetical protein
LKRILDELLKESSALFRVTTPWHPFPLGLNNVFHGYEQAFASLASLDLLSRHVRTT